MAGTAFHPRGVSIDQVVDSYRTFLSRNRYYLHLELFERRSNSDRYAAAAEAVLFSILWSAKARPDIFEDPSTGGPDFLCRPSKSETFLVEVTSLQARAASRRSGLPEKMTGSGGGAFALITPALNNAAASKAAQLAGHPHPRVLAITLSYDFAGLLIHRLAAERLLVSDPVIRHTLGEPADRAAQFTDLRRSAFLRPGKSGREIICYRRSISAILLVAISGARSDMVGILHPEPAVPFSPSVFPLVPYLRLKNWPILDGRIATEWVGGDENQEATFWHTKIA
jgi:hypothetical protein